MKKIILGSFCLLIFLATACKSDYEKAVNEEKAKGQIYTDLPMDLEMGMTKKAYFDLCWKLNKQGIIGAGPGNQYAQYKLLPKGHTDSLNTITMLFYGMFDEEKIMRGMDLIMEFENWAPWNEKYHSPVLISTLEEHYMEVYPGNDFFKFNVNNELDAKVKVDGNRRITMYPLSNKKVAVKIVDLRYVDTIVK